MKFQHYCIAIIAFSPAAVFAQTPATKTSVDQTSEITFGPYEYEVKPDDPAFGPFNPRLAPKPGPLLLRTGDRLAICGDSITEQKMYSRLIETYLTVCTPELGITVRQYGWSGEKADGFLRRMDQDCLTFEPTVATLAYGMNDARYRPFDLNNGKMYEDYYTAIVRKFKEHDVRVVLGSPGCSGKIASWVKTANGTLQEHNLNLCALRDIGIGIAQRENVRFADIFWPMYQAQVFAPGQHNAGQDRPYDVAGRDGIHPGWAGHVIMAYAFLRSMGLDGNLGAVRVNLAKSSASATDGHRVDSFTDGSVQVTSSRLAYCARGDENSDSSIRSGMTLVPFADDLNRFLLFVEDADLSAKYQVTWGEESREFEGEELVRGINLPEMFPSNPMCDVFDRVDNAVAAKQAYETEQVKKVFHGKDASNDFAQAVADTEAVRKPLADAIASAFSPVTHTVRVQKVD